MKTYYALMEVQKTSPY